MKNNKVVLAFSGGLDTTYCAIYLTKVKNMVDESIIRERIDPDILNVFNNNPYTQSLASAV